MQHPDFTMSQYATKEDLYKAKAEYFESLVKGYEQTISADPLDDVYVVVAERDHGDPIKSRGSICFETYTGGSDMCKAVERAKSIGDKYGDVIICKLVKVGSVELCEKIINAPI